MAGIKRQLEADEERRAAESPGPARLGDMQRDGLDIFCWCNRCGHNAVVATAMLVAQLGPAMPVPEVGARMRCTSCGSKDVATRPNWPSLGVIARH